MQFLKKRKFYLVLPILVLPFLTLVFISLGGGGGTPETKEEPSSLNKQLPEAKNLGEALDKMSLYNQAVKDSLELGGQLSASGFEGAADTAKTDILGNRQNYSGSGYVRSYPSAGQADPNEARVQAKLAELERAMNRTDYPSAIDYSSANRPDSRNAELARMEAMMKALTGGKVPIGVGDSAEDPEIRQLNSMLEKIMDIQHPELAREKLKSLSEKNKGRVYSVSGYRKDLKAELLKAGFIKQAKPDFYDLESSTSEPDSLIGTAIPAVVHESQTLLSGQSVKLRLTEPVYLNGQLLPQGSFISGFCSVGGERLNIAVNSIKYQNSIFPVSLVAYGMDGLEGLRIQDAISRDAANSGSDRALQSVQLMSLDPSLATQAAGAGIETVKGIFSKKAKLIKVSIKAGHPLLLLDMKAAQASNSN